MVEIAPGYSEQQVLLCTINPFENSDLKQYLINGRVPTVRVFFKGKATSHSFLGNQEKAFVKDFFDKVIEEHKDAADNTDERQAIRQIQDSAELEEVISSSEVPVIVKFAAFF